MVNFDVLKSCNWKVSFDNPELQERLGKRVEYWEAEFLQTAVKIILSSPKTNQSLEIDFYNNMLSTPNGYTNGYSNEIIFKPEGITIISEKYGTIQMVEYSL